MNFFAKYQRIFMIAGFLILVIAIGYLLYLIFVKPSLSPTGTGNQNVATSSSTGKLPNAGAGTPNNNNTSSSSSVGIPNPATKNNQPDVKAQGGITAAPIVTSSPAISPTLAANGSGVQYYNQNDGKFYRIDANGDATPLSDEIFHNVSDVVWAPQKDKAIIEYPDNSKILFNFNTQKQVTLPANWNQFNFSADGSQIVLKTAAIDTENNFLAIANADGSGAKIIEPVGANGNTVIDSWSPNNQTVAMYTKGVDVDRQEVFFVGKNDENFKSTIVEGHGFEPQWSTAGDQLAYSVYSSATNMKPELWAVDAQGDSIGANRRDLGVATFASKCTFSDNDTMYCGVPQTLQTGAGFIPELSQNTTDNLYKINIKTGAKQMIAIPNGNFTMSNLSVSSDGSSLFFQDSNTKLVHKVQLK
jgi:hypothetical protein